MKLTDAEIRSVTWLSNAVRSRQFSQTQLAKAIGVHQSQVSRILSGQSKISSPNVRKICKYADSMRAVAGVSSADPKQLLGNAVQQIWDGSLDHARALTALIEAVGGTQSAYKRDSQ